MTNKNDQLLAKIQGPNMTDAAGAYITNIAVSLQGSSGTYIPRGS